MQVGSTLAFSLLRALAELAFIEDGEDLGLGVGYSKNQEGFFLML